MYVIHAIEHPFHENSNSWIVGIDNDKDAADNLTKKLREGMSLLQMCRDDYWWDKNDGQVAELRQTHPQICPTDSELANIKKYTKGCDWTSLVNEHIEHLIRIHPRALPEYGTNTDAEGANKYCYYSDDEIRYYVSDLDGKCIDTHQQEYLNREKFSNSVIFKV